MSVIKTHRELEIWKRGMRFVSRVYELTSAYPNEERYGLVSQTRRSAVSFPSNIAEGAARSSKKDFVYFLHISQGSLAELETQLLIAQDLGYLPRNELLNEVEELSKMTSSFIKHLKSKDT